MKCAIFNTLLLLIVAAASCCSPKMPVDNTNKNYIKQTPKIPVSISPLKDRSSDMVVVPYFNKSNRTFIILDPGHGGDDFGTHSLGRAKYQEKHLNLSTTLLVKEFLQQFGYKVVMTRTDDSFVGLDERAQMANKQKPILFVSIHYNSAPSTSAEGIEVFYYQDNDDKNRTAKSKKLAQSVLDQTIQMTQAVSRGVKQGNLAVLRETNMPAILIEGGFMTCTEEMAKIKTASYQKSLALGIAKGIQAYLEAQAKG